MHGPDASIAQDETAWTTWIVRVVLQDVSGRDDLFEVEDIEILREPLLLGVDGEFIAFTLDEAANLLNVHERLSEASGRGPSQRWQ